MTWGPLTSLLFRTQCNDILTSCKVYRTFHGRDVAPTSSPLQTRRNAMTIPKLLAYAALATATVSLPFCHHGQAAAQAETVTLDAQGHSPEWEQNPHMVEFYALSVEMLRAARRVDADAYEQRSYAIFRAFAESLGASPEGMIDHL